MDITIKDLSSLTGMSKHSVRNYMSRAEFSHIPLRRGLFCGIERDDVVRLIQVYKDRNYRRKDVI